MKILKSREIIKVLKKIAVVNLTSKHAYDTLHSMLVLSYKPIYKFFYEVQEELIDNLNILQRSFEREATPTSSANTATTISKLPIDAIGNMSIKSISITQEKAHPKFQIGINATNYWQFFSFDLGSTKTTITIDLQQKTE